MNNRVNISNPYRIGQNGVNFTNISNNATIKNIQNNVFNHLKTTNTIFFVDLYSFTYFNGERISQLIYNCYKYFIRSGLMNNRNVNIFPANLTTFPEFIPQHLRLEYALYYFYVRTIQLQSGKYSRNHFINDFVFDHLFPENTYHVFMKQLTKICELGDVYIVDTLELTNNIQNVNYDLRDIFVSTFLPKFIEYRPIRFKYMDYPGARSFGINIHRENIYKRANVMYITNMPLLEFERYIGINYISRFSIKSNMIFRKGQFTIYDNIQRKQTGDFEPPLIKSILLYNTEDLNGLLLRYKKQNLIIPDLENIYQFLHLVYSMKPKSIINRIKGSFRRNNSN
jgi:hypothetical protein